MTMRNGRCCPAADTQEPNINCAGVGSALCWWMLGVWAPASSQENTDDIDVILAHRLRHCQSLMSSGLHSDPLQRDWLRLPTLSDHRWLQCPRRSTQNDYGMEERLHGRRARLLWRLRCRQDVLFLYSSSDWVFLTTEMSCTISQLSSPHDALGRR